MKTLSQNRKKEIASLALRKYRQRIGQFVIEGLRAVEAAAAARFPLLEIVATAEMAERARALAAKAGVESYVIDQGDMQRLSEVETAQGILAVGETRWLAEDGLAGRSRVLALDGLQDPGNLGTIVRTAAWFGIDAVVAGPGTVDFFAPKVVRAAMGGLFDLPVSRTSDLPSLLRSLAERGYEIYGADMHGVPVSGWEPEGHDVLVLGNEANGISGEVRKALTGTVSVTRGAGARGTESLNVAMAAGILLYEWTR
jgi:RNA methyltransferase, TrmH family